MTLITMRRALVFTPLLAASVCVTHAQAQLGSTLPADDGAQLRLLTPGNVRMRSTVDLGGTTINEYAAADGTVFAYTWQGPTMPDLTRMLGRYADAYRTNAASKLATSGNLHASRVEQPDVIVESGGQMRSYIGRAWLPRAMPPGFAAADLH